MRFWLCQTGSRKAAAQNIRQQREALLPNTTPFSFRIKRIMQRRSTLKSFFIIHRKLWIPCLFSILVAAAAFLLLPAEIPVHFSGGIADQFANKILLFIFPFLQAFLLLCTGAKPFRQWYMAYKSTEKSETQYEGILFCVTLLLSLVETVVILYAGLSA